MSYSLRRRVIIISTVWTVVAVLGLGWFLLNQYRANAESGFADLQQAQLFSLIAAFTIGADGALEGRPNLGDQSFLQTGSGWYWQVGIINRTGAPPMRSPSLSDIDLPRPSLDDIPYDDQFSRTYVQEGAFGNRLRILEAEIQIGSDGEIALFQLAGNQSAFDEAIAGLAQNIAFLLTIFAIGVIAINGLIIVIGMRPLDRVRGAIQEIHTGRSHSLDGDYPHEIQPVVDEMNTLIDNNRRIVERARTQVGNLAHSLKTPISVMQNEAARHATVSSALVSEQSQSMKAQVDHYLKRARIAAQSGGTAFRTDAVQAMERLVRVMTKLNQDKDIDFERPTQPIAFAGEKEDFEEVFGNILENASKWAASRIKVEMDLVTGNVEQTFSITVHDDGPGINANDRHKALKRGQRLDESTPGTGLGLSIVVETVRAYHGDIVLSDSDLGGLAVTITLPRARSVD